MTAPYRAVSVPAGTLRTLVACLALAALGAVPVRGQVGLEREVVSLEFAGNRAFSDDRLTSAIVLDETRCKTFAFAPFRRPTRGRGSPAIRADGRPRSNPRSRRADG